MPCFEDAAEVEELLGGALRSATEEKGRGGESGHPVATMRLELSHPDVRLTLPLPAGSERDTHGEPPDEGAGVVIEATADDAHRLLLDELDLPSALARGRLRARGPLARLIASLPLDRALSDRYRAALVERGRGDLLAAGGGQGR